MAKLREPAATYEAPAVAPAQRAKLFPNGRSQAVRLPKEFRMPGTEVKISREGNRIILEPISDPPVDALGWPIGFKEEMAQWRKGLDLDDFKLEDDPVPEPIKPWDED